MTLEKLKLSELKNSKWVKKFGLVGLIIFLLKGLVWIVVLLWMWHGAK